MDGFALRSTETASAETGNKVRLEVIGRIAAGGGEAVTVQAGQCARIMTGAPLPEGADAVVPFEEVEDSGDHIVLSAPIAPGSSVRPSGNDLRAGQTVIQRGTELTPRHIGLLGALGIPSVAVVRKPVVALMATGDELREPGESLGPGQIYNSNTPMLQAAVIEAGGSPYPIGSVSDDPAAIAKAVAEAREADLLITSGGASVGDSDYVKEVLGQSGKLNFWRVRVRPGKPLLFGLLGNVPLIGLPGNPTSAMVTFEEFVRPAIRTMLGTHPFRPEVQAVVDERIDNHGGRQTYARVSLRYRDGQFHASLTGAQDSAMLLTLAQADGLLIIAASKEEVLPGEIAKVQVLRLPDA